MQNMLTERDKDNYMLIKKEKIKNLEKLRIMAECDADDCNLKCKDMDEKLKLVNKIYIFKFIEIKLNFIIKYIIWKIIRILIFVIL